MSESLAQPAAQETAPLSAGRILAQARQKQDMSVADVARALRLGVKQVEALEADDFAKLPGRTFVRGFMRNYARLLQLDPDEIVAASALGGDVATASQAIQVPSQHIRFSENQARPWVKFVGALAVLVALASWGVLEWMGPEQGKAGHKVAANTVTAAPPAETRSSETPVVLPSPPAAQPAPTPVQPAPAVVQPTPAMVQPAPAAMPTEPVPPSPEVRIPTPAPQDQAASMPAASFVLEFAGPSWVDVRDRKGKRIFSQMNQAGTQQTVAGEPPFSLVVGNAPKVKLTYKGQPVDLAAHAKADVARLKLE